MCGGNQPRRLPKILNPRQGDVELHGKHEAAFRSGKQGHTAVVETSPTSTRSRRATAPRALSKHAA